MKMSLNVSFNFFYFKGNIVILSYKQSIKKLEKTRKPFFSSFKFFYFKNIQVIS
jgi:hypothetical protein